MKARFFTLLGFFLLTNLAMAENKPAGVFANFETVIPGGYNVCWGMFTDPECYAVVDNPLIDATNVSAKCLKILQKADFKPWGSYAWFVVNMDMPNGDSMIVARTSAKHYLHVKYLSNVVSQRIGFNLVAAAGKAFQSSQTVTVTGKWVDAVFDLDVEGNQLTAAYEIGINPNFDFEWFPGDLANQTTYIDDIEFTDSPAPRVYALPEKTLANFETVIPTANATWGNVTDAAAVTVVDNPTSDAVNSTAKCLKVLQKASYQPWANGDLYCAVMPFSPEVTLDVTNPSHFLHFKYLSNKVGATINFEILQTEADLFDFPVTVTEVGKWVDVVIDLSRTDFTLTKIKEIAFSPNNTYQTKGNTADEITYLDGIVINNIATAGGTGTTVSKVLEKEINVFSSNSSDDIRIAGISERTTASVYNTNGKLFQTKILSAGLNQINISDLATGVYIIKFQTESGIVTRKFLKR